MKLPRPAQYFNIHWDGGETTGKKSPFRNYILEGMRKLFPTYPPGKCLPSALQKCLFTEAPGGEPATCPT